MDEFDVGPYDFILGIFTGIILTAFVGYAFLPEGELTGVKRDKIANVKYVEYDNSVYILVPYKNIVKEK